MIAALWLWSGNAHAVTATYCFEWGTAFGDAATGDYLNGTATAARGALVRFVQNDGGGTTYAVLAAGGATPGCGTVVGLNAEPYSVWLDLNAVVNGNTVLVKNASGIQLTSQRSSNHTPQSGATYSYPGTSWTRTSVTDGISIMAAAQWALNRVNGGVSGVTFDFRTQTCPNSPAGTSCYDDNVTRLISIAPGTTGKFTIVHELGHALVDAATGQLGYAYDGSAAMGPCIPGETATHRVNTKEYNGTAAIEGIASFYAQLAFNDHGANADCVYQTPYTVDWNHDGDTIDGADAAVFTCEGGVAGIAAEDYVGTECGGGLNRSTQYDWMRGLWDLHTDDGVSFNDILDVWVLAQPSAWNASGSGVGPTYPAYEMATAAAAVLSPNPYPANAADNGMDQ